MDKLPKNNIDLWNKSVEHSSPELVIERIHRQLQHDFERVGIPFELDKKSNPKEWIQYISTVLLTLDNHQLPQLLYLIDVPESLTRILLSAQDNYHQLAEAILYRELTKVYFKIQYSGNSNTNNLLNSE